MRYTAYREKFEGGEHTYVFKTLACPVCQKTEELEVKAADLFAYNQGAFIQTAFPYLSAAQRERLISGYCEPCFDKLFGEDDGA